MRNAGKDQSPLHPRNQHRSRYDFELLLSAYPLLKEFVFLNKYGDESIDFANPDAVKALNKALLIHYYNISEWDIPAGYLCPPIPGRADYLHYAADLMASFHQHTIPTGKKIKVLDIGVGANCIYPMIGHHEYGWSFVGADIDQMAIRNAKNIVDVNPTLKNKVEIRLQNNATAVFNGIVQKQEYFDLTICNPPFHASAEEALMGSQRKTRNLGRKNYLNPVLNFGGKNSELWTTGGELGFIEKMINESVGYQNQCFLFTTLVSKSENLPFVFSILQNAKATEIRTQEMTTGNKITRIVAWTFLSAEKQGEWVERWK